MPFVIGVAGSVAVGKSTTARVLRELLARWPDHPRVELVTTDGFLLPNAELERRGMLHRKGFPESLRPARPAAVPRGGEVRRRRRWRRRSTRTCLRHRARRARSRSRSPDILDRRGPQRAAAAAPAGRRPQPDERLGLLRLLGLRRRRHRRRTPSGTSSGSCACAGPRSPTRPRTSAATPRCPTRRPARPRCRSGPRSTSRTWCRTSCPPAAGRPWCSRRAPTTPYAGSGSASCRSESRARP